MRCITPKRGRVSVAPFMTDETGGVVHMVHLMYRCNMLYSFLLYSCFIYNMYNMFVIYR